METTKKHEQEKNTYLQIPVGAIVSNKENQRILKQLLFRKPKKEKFDVQALIDSCDTKIKHPRFKE